MWMLRLVGALAEFVGDVPGKNIHDAGIFAATRDDNIRKFHLFNPTREQFKNLFREAGFTETKIHTKDGEDWICVEGTK